MAHYARACRRAHCLVPVALAVVFAASTSHAQSPAFNRSVIVLDPAHGGADGGARISDQLQEKDVTLAIASRLRSLLTARGFTVVSTREDDSSAPANRSTDQRAELANRAHAVACLVIHASSSGSGVYIATSTIGSTLATPPAGSGTDSTQISANGAVPWDRAQEVYVQQSLLLSNQIAAALGRSSLPTLMGRAALRPLDNLMCPAISIEVRTLHRADSGSTPVSDSGYQQQVVEAIAGALVRWRNQAQPPEYFSLPRSGAELVTPHRAISPEDKVRSGL